MAKIKPGSVVVWEPANFNPDYWNGLTEEERIHHYGDLGYGAKKPVHFVFLCEIIQIPGHCVLLNMDNNKIESMRHTCEFRVVSEDEV